MYRINKHITIDVETWKTVKINDCYEVSNYGNIRRVKPARGAKPGKILKQHLWGNYLTVHLSKNCEVKLHRIADLVMESFIGPKPTGYMTLHFDDNPYNNNLLNLRYGTKRDNTIDALRNGKRTNKGYKHTLETKTIIGNKLRGKSKSKIAKFNMKIAQINRRKNENKA